MKGITVRKPKVIEAIMFYDSKYATNKEARNIFNGLVNTLGGTLLTCSPNTHRTIMIITTEGKYVEIYVCKK